jgi:ketosteroid isomerase-like protein
VVWTTVTVKGELVKNDGKIEMGTYRWTAVFENQGGKWLIVHDHFSAPLQ